MFFENPDVEAKYKNTMGDRDPVISVTVGYHGPLSKAPMHIADKVFSDGAHIELKKPAEKQPAADKKEPVK